MKCLEKERSRRYETANGLATDILRHLGTNDRCPTAVEPVSIPEICSTKQGMATAGTAVTLALVVGLTVSLWLLRRESAERKRAIAAEHTAQASQAQAQIEASKSRQVAQFMEGMLKGSGPAVARGRDTTLLREVLDQTAQRMTNELKDQPEVEAELRITIGEVYNSLARFSEAEQMHREALAIRRRLHPEAHWEVVASLNF